MLKLVFDDIVICLRVCIMQGELSIMVFPECVWTSKHVLFNPRPR